ncbi:HEAT repeat domain-containing protein [Cohnella nanjingensis]|uniref:HEAT repeat domain-containing protein n=1 Tax=Cohnella nanjingensis TaxID=1387779 RepID=A0A7X0VFR0_9BACL|nr:HEAT repeat domain-containing protein [Cohnella nanjingensis]MBB6672307.1 HEAT repeat domain-containing protein [Cohnella nanjingensis]
MADSTKDNLVLFPKTLDYYQIQLTRMLETERYGEAKGLLGFLLQCGGEAERHHTEWQALLGWLEAAFPEASSSGLPGSFDDEDQDGDAEDGLRQRVVDRSGQDAEYIPRLIATLFNVDDPEQQLVALGQLAHVEHPDVEAALRRWLGERERHPLVQFRVLQQLRKLGASGPAAMWREGENLLVEIEQTPLQFEDYPQAVQDVLDRVRQTAEVSDPTLAYFAEEMWKECAQTAYGTPVFRRMMEDDDGASDVWAAGLHQFLLEKLHAQSNDEWVREQYGITGDLRFRYEQALRWLRQYAGEGRP